MVRQLAVRFYSTYVVQVSDESHMASLEAKRRDLRFFKCDSPRGWLILGISTELHLRGLYSILSKHILEQPCFARTRITLHSPVRSWVLTPTKQTRFVGYCDGICRGIPTPLILRIAQLNCPIKRHAELPMPNDFYSPFRSSMDPVIDPKDEEFATRRKTPIGTPDKLLAKMPKLDPPAKPQPLRWESLAGMSGSIAFDLRNDEQPVGGGLPPGSLLFELLESQRQEAAWRGPGTKL
jgi:hypothetical protein